jgi:hypothetical protein
MAIAVLINSYVVHVNDSLSTCCEQRHAMCLTVQTPPIAAFRYQNTPASPLLHFDKASWQQFSG